METGQIELCGFVLEGARGDYSGSMGVFLCQGMFRFLASVGLPPKTLDFGGYFAQVVNDGTAVI